MTTPIDRESVEVLAQIFSQERDAFTAKTLLALRAALDAAEAKNKRLQKLVLKIVASGDAPYDWMNEAEAAIGMTETEARAALQENPDG